MSNEIFEFLDGKRFKLNDYEGTFKLETYPVQYPSRQIIERLNHEPDHDTVAYQLKKQEMNDDWLTDLTDAIDRYCAIATLLGYQYEGNWGNYQTQLTGIFFLTKPEHKRALGAWTEVQDFDLYLKNYVKGLIEKHRSWVKSPGSHLVDIPESVSGGLIALWEEKMPEDLGYRIDEIFDTINWSILSQKIQVELGT